MYISIVILIIESNKKQRAIPNNITYPNVKNSLIRPKSFKYSWGQCRVQYFDAQPEIKNNDDKKVFCPLSDSLFINLSSVKGIVLCHPKVTDAIPAKTAKAAPVMLVVSNVGLISIK